MSNPNRYREVIDGKEYEATNNVLGVYVPKYASFAPEFGKEVYLTDNDVAVGDLGSVAVEKKTVERSMER